MPKKKKGGGPGGARPGAGRKRIQIDPQQVEALAAIQCTMEEIAHGLLISIDTLERRQRDTPEIAAALQRGRAQGRISLRREQWRAAQRGNATMLIWLGKQWLQQRDLRSHEVEVAPGAGGEQPFTFSVVPFDPEKHGNGDARGGNGGPPDPATD